MHSSSVRRLPFLFALIFLFCAGVARPQAGTASLRGTVTDKSGGTIPGAKVSLKNAALGFDRTTTTGKTGQYEFLALQPGTYQVSIEKQNFQKFLQSGLQLLVDSPATLDVQLQVGSSSETVEVVAQTEALNTTDASLGVAFNQHQVKELPLEGRNVPDLLTLQAGVVYIGNNPNIDTNIDTRSGAVNGARSDQSNVMVDGISVNNRAGNAFTSVLPVTLDSVEEFRVTTTNYNADQGGTGGAQVSLVTKSGTNQLHGSAYEYLRNTYTSANDYFNKQAQLSSDLPNTPPKLIRNIFGGSLGGPIKKDRLFLFLNYEGTRRAEAQVVTSPVPSDTARDGIVEYPCATSSQCPATTVQGLSGKTYNVAAGNYALDPATIQMMDPLHVGVSPVIQQFFNGGYWPHGNSTNAGDGLNTVGYVFSSPIGLTQNWYIGKMDYNITRDGKHHIYVSGALANMSNPGAAFLPGQAAEHTLVNFNKGIIVGYSGVITNNVINTLRYGYIRESVGDTGNSSQQWVELRGLTDGATNAIVRSQQFERPIQTISDDVSWTHGRHTFEFGGVIKFVKDGTSNYGTAFSDGIVNSAWLDTGGISNSDKSPLNPSYAVNGTAVYNLPAVDTNSFGGNYDFAIANAVGFVSETDAYYNYLKDGSVQNQGTAVARHYAENGYELYAQDVWKVTPTFTLTAGLRYSLFSPPWETNGLQVAPSPSLASWFSQRYNNMINGIPSSADPAISFDLAGPQNGGKPSYYNWDYKDLGPRLAFAWAPNQDGGLLGSLFGKGKTSIRGGFAVVYDSVGESLINTFDSNGAFGLSTLLSNPAGSQSLLTAPRVTDIHTIPATDLTGATLLLPPPVGKFPQTFPDSLSTGGFAIAWGLDNSIKTPYAYTIDFSVQRDLGKGFTIETAYVGRMGHGLLAQEDLAQPSDLVDKKTGVDYYKAIQALATLYRKGVPTSQINAGAVGSTASYWTDIIKPLQPGGAYSLFCSGGSTISPLQAAYDLFRCFSTNETTALSVLDGNTSPYGIPDANSSALYNAGTGPFTFFNPQYSSLYAWRNAGNTSYNAFQLTVRHQLIHGFQFDANYTYSKSMDLASDATRINWVGGLGGQITNAWDPNQNRAVSDYDLRHQFNTNFTFDLPFGRGRWIAHDTNKAVDAVIGGWQLTGLFRMTSGFPVNIGNVFGFPTDWELTGLAFNTSPVATGHYSVLDGNGNPNISVFATGANAINSFTSPFPGQSGARNQIRGQGYRGLDLGLSKSWTMPWSESQKLQLRWEVFNVTNTPIFNVQTAQLALSSGTTFGDYTSLLNQPRVMQFALRFDF